MADRLPCFEDAEAFRKTDPAKALELFRRLWKEQGQFRAAARYAYCLRKLGRADEAVAVCRAALEKYPRNRYVSSELVWDLYETKIKPAKKDDDLDAVLGAANEIYALEPDDLAQQRVGLTVMQVAKAKSKWKIVVEWAGRLDPAKFSNQARQLDGRKGMSDREIFYIAKSRALLETMKFAEARAVAQLGMEEFPDDIFIARTAALALAGEGQIEHAAAELKTLIMKQHADWYVKVDLADLELKRGNAIEAYRLCCEAAQNPQDEKFKLSLFLTLARAALATGQWQTGAEHITLCKAIRENNGWKIPAALAQLEENILSAMNGASQEWPLLPSDVRELSKICRQRWQEGASAGLVRKTGKLGRIDSSKPFSFIFPDDRSEKVFVLLKNIPQTLTIEGERVEFALKPSFDKKKGVQSFEAVDIRPGGG